MIMNTPPTPPLDICVFCVLVGKNTQNTQERIAMDKREVKIIVWTIIIGALAVVVLSVVGSLV